MNKRRFCAGRYENGRLYVRIAGGKWTDLSTLL